MNTRIQLYHSAALLAIAVAAVGFAMARTQLPRPWILFAGLSIAIGILAYRVIRYQVPSTGESLAILGETVLIGYFLRVSGYLHLAASGRDTQMWAGAIGTIVETGYASGGGMYEASPIYLIEVAVLGIIYGSMPRSASVLGEHNVSVIVASFLPILVAAITIRFAERRAGLLAGLLTIVFPLYLRTATLYESEHLALLWFSLLILLFQVSASQRDQWVSTIFVLTLVASAWLHFFYATVFVVLFAGATAVRGVMESILFLPERRPQIQILGIVTGGVFITLHILWSGWAGHAVGVLSSVFTISVPTSISGLFFPSSGAAGSSVGSGGGGLFVTILKHLPIGLLLLLAGIGGFYALVHPKQYGMEAIAIAVVSVGGTVILLVAQLGYNLHFRMFYFAGTLTLVFAGAALARGAEMDLGYPNALSITLTFLILTVAITGPLSPMGNNVDPHFDETDWVTRSATWDQKENLGALTIGDQPLKERSRHFIVGPKPGRYASYPSPVIVDDAECGFDSEVWDSGTVHGCINNTFRG